MRAWWATLRALANGICRCCGLGKAMVSVARFELATPSTPRKCATRLRYTEMLETKPAGILPLQLVQDRAQLALDRGHVDAGAGDDAELPRGGGLWFLLDLHPGVIESVARTADGEAFFVQQLADAADEEHFMMLV